MSPRKGVIRVKLQPEVAAQVGSTAKVRSKAGTLSTGVKLLDTSAERVKAVSIKRVFPYVAKFEERRKKYGLDRWYEVTFDESLSPEQAKNVFKNTAGVQIAELEIPMELKDGSKNKYRKLTAADIAKMGTPKTAMPFNDPRLGLQWHYNNDGSMPGSVAGADINLFNAWKTETGKSNVLIAIIDGGVDYSHEDLAQNMWVNQKELNGKPGVYDDGDVYVDDIYGYNFVTKTGEIYPHSLGTHVAGTVGTVNNNGIGMCGVAGGDGTNGGVKMISCQVFDPRAANSDGNFAEAIVYAAEIGASIAQCSWGWGTAGYYEQAVLDAIDYFTEYGGGDNLKGGLCIFAAGNEGEEGQFYPACYEKTLAVTSMCFDKTAANYSCRGKWADVAAPGGYMDYDQAQGVLSTLPSNTYGYSEGTSMAAPHVSGIAALILSKYGSKNLLNETLRQQLVTSVNDFYKVNPGVEGLFGS